MEIDLNCDLGEGCPHDAELMPLITSANVACGWHAGNPETMRATMVLARLLTPQDFGLVAMVTTVIGFFRIFNDAGLSTATVQRESITHAQVSNLFWTNVTLGVTISLILAISAPGIAWFYQEPRLVSITLALSITFLFTTSTVQHMALLKRQMRFKAIALIQVSSVAGGLNRNFAAADLSEFIFSEHEPRSEQAPLHPTKLELEPCGVCRLTLVPRL